MPKTRIDVTINSRQYTVVADESEEYIKKLASHIDGIVKTVIRGGQNIIGERPVVLAALNICNEYYKSAEAADILKLQIEKRDKDIRELKEKLDRAENVTPQISFDEADAEKRLEDARKEADTLRRSLSESESAASEFKNKFEDAKSRLADFEEMINAADKELNAANEKIRENNIKITQLEERLSRYEGKANNRQTRGSVLNGASNTANEKRN
ncbi:MAG: cell division protein ZapA [Firmicutes bacterium]|nr:cell division protein ZapA [Bacillota bacterium]